MATSFFFHFLAMVKHAYNGGLIVAVTKSLSSTLECFSASIATVVYDY